jgi:hypothetical protein
MHKFYNNLNNLQESLINHSEFGPRFLYLHEKFTGYSPSFYCLPTNESNEYFFTTSSSSPSSENRLRNPTKKEIDPSLDIYVIQENNNSLLYNFFEGLIESTANFLWNLNVKIEKITKSSFQLSLINKQQANNIVETNNSPCIMGYQIKLNSSKTSSAHKLKKNTKKFYYNNNEISSNPKDLSINLDLLKATFPFAILFDRKLDIRHVGDGLIRHLGPSINLGYGTAFLTYFTIVSPKLNEYTFNSILINHNMSFKLKTKLVDSIKSSQFKDMELKGSVSYLPESDCLIFIGSPIIVRLEELTKRELYISDIPIHDATRDIILIGEQTKAQVYLYKDFIY